MKTMKAARLHAYGHPLKIEEVPVPEIGPDDLLVEVKACGICHTDLGICDGSFPVSQLPRILGHEVAGVVAERGGAVRNVEVGDRVCVDGVVPCGKCRYCMSGRENICSSAMTIGSHVDGGWAEYVRVPAANAFPLPEAVPFDQGAVLADAVACTFHAMKRGEVQPGDTVAIFGTGGLAISAVQVAKAFGATKVIAVGRSDQRLDLARKAGADELVNSTQQDPVRAIKALTGGLGAEVAVELIGFDKTIQQTIECVCKGGRAVIVGLHPGTAEIRPYYLAAKEIDIKGVWTVLRQDFPRVIELVKTGKIDPSILISHRVSLDEVNKGIEILQKRLENPLRVAICMDN